MTPPCVLTIAGSDSGGGAGIQADLKTFAALGCFGTSVITAVTAQNRHEVRSIQRIDPKIVGDQIEAVLEDFPVRSIKIGMLCDAEIVSTVATSLCDVKIPIVLDPVLVSTTGTPLLQREAVSHLLRKLVPLATVVTPNADEAKFFTDSPHPILFKSHKMDEETITDLLKIGTEEIPFSKKRIVTKNSHGTGCVLSSAIAAYLANGKSLLEAVSMAENFMNKAIRFDPMVSLRNEAERWSVLQEIRTALQIFQKENIRELIPEVGSQFVVATPYAETPEEIAGVEGRITKTKEGIQIGAGPWFGVSTHMANLLLTARQFDPTLRAVMNIRYDPAIVKICRRIGLQGAFFSRAEEPIANKTKEGNTLQWAVDRVTRQCGRVPDFIADEGEVGKEPMIRLLAKNSTSLVQSVLKIQSLFSGQSLPSAA
ncbi:MAG: bifunctional hydroxymethylpyrimidine kinase/phosphomethylpyrimidine kinase [Deltaproteobacteria bacterium]|nr:bifunctional hydroxymethylpyrimidine kinase/phosphomethylpyrimidine kinase [Deltaproteobacteria bacterium]